ncbi:MAG: dTDP-glucose 4,6-dehydratase [Opitutales bacterium]|nr:dTDP-glucose 4,6-dehydratase [Opitutales bacterium]
MKSLFVTGGLGFIGSNFIHKLLKSGEFDLVINFDKETYAGNQENLAFFESDPRYVFCKGNICDAELVSNLLFEHQPEAVVNFAAESHVDRSIDGPEPFVQTNIVGTLRLLEAFKSYYNSQSDDRKSSLRFLHVSTDEVYGSLKPEDPAFCETTPYAPNSPYSASKASADHLVRAYHHTFGLPVLTTNCSNNYGPYQFPEKLIPLMILNACEGKNLPIYGNGSNIRDWLHVEDHCSGILSVLQQGRVGETYCIGGASEKTNMEVIDTLCDILDRHHPAGAPHNQLKTFVTDRPGHDHRYAIDFSKIKNELGWQPSYSFEEGMEQTVDWYLNHQKWCENVTSGKYQRERLGI